MVQRRLVTLFATAVITLATGCATDGTGAVARLTESDASRSTIASELRGPGAAGSCRPAVMVT